MLRTVAQLTLIAGKWWTQSVTGWRFSSSARYCSRRVARATTNAAGHGSSCRVATFARTSGQAAVNGCRRGSGTRSSAATFQNSAPSVRHARPHPVNETSVFVNIDFFVWYSIGSLVRAIDPSNFQEKIETK